MTLARDQGLYRAQLEVCQLCLPVAGEEDTVIAYFLEAQREAVLQEAPDDA
jgi:hypothetical protein